MTVYDGRVYFGEVSYWTTFGNLPLTTVMLAGLQSNNMIFYAFVDFYPNDAPNRYQIKPPSVQKMNNMVICWIQYPYEMFDKFIEESKNSSRIILHVDDSNGYATDIRMSI